MTEKSLQGLNFQSDSPLDTENLSLKQNPKIPSPTKEERANEMDEVKLCNEEQPEQPNSSLLKREWSSQEDQLVYNLHNQYGNKWAIIAQQLKGRTDNCIKNHFYSRLRKGLRKINKLIQDSLSKQFKQFKVIDLYKVIEASDEKFKQYNSYPNEMTDFGHDLKNRLFIFAQEESDGSQEFDLKAKQLLDDMNDFTKNYKRKSKKSRRYSPMGVGSVYRNIKKQTQPTETGQTQIKKTEEQAQESIKIQPIVKIEQELQKRQRKVRQKKQVQKVVQVSKQSILVPQKKQAAKEISLPQLLQVIEEPLNRSRNKNTYRQFSDDEGEQKDEAEYLKEQRLNHFAENILKTFKSYYSFKSFKSNPMMDDFIFQ